MTMLTGLLLITLSACSFAIVRRILHPAPLFPLIWAGVVILDAALAGIWVDPLRSEANSIFVLGAICFVAGSLAFDLWGSRAFRDVALPLPARRMEVNFRSLTLFCLVLHVIFLPLWWREIVRIAGDASSILVIAYRVRAATASYEDSMGGLVANYLVLGLILMPILLIGRVRREIPLSLLLVAVVPWLLVNLVASGRGALLQFVIASGYAVHVQAGRIRKATALGLISVFLLVFVGGILLVQKEGITANSEVGDLAKASVENFFGYLLQGSVLFGKYIIGNIGVDARWDALSFFCHVGSKFGLCTPENTHLDFNPYRPDGAWGNVYSVYFSLYPKYGTLGVAAFMALYGYWSTLHHERAKHSLANTLVAGYLMSAIVTSIFADFFLPSLNLLVKAYLVGFLVPIVWRRRGGTPTRGGAAVERSAS